MILNSIFVEKQVPDCDQILNELEEFENLQMELENAELSLYSETCMYRFYLIC